MIYNVLTKITQIIETASIPGVNAVIAGMQRLIPGVQYPAVIVDITDFEIGGQPRQIECKISGTVTALSMQPANAGGFDGVTSAIEELSDIAFDFTTKTGIIPTLLSPPSFSIDSQRYLIQVERGKLREGVDSTGRSVMGIEIPIIITTKTNLL